MKAVLFALTTTIILSTSALACGGYGNYFSALSVNALFPSDLSLVIDDVYYTSMGSNIDLTDLLPGSHKVTVSRKSLSQYGSSCSKVVYNGVVEIPSNSRLTMTIGKNDHVQMSTKKLINPSFVVEPTASCGGNNTGNFSLFKQKLDSESFDSNKLKMARQYVSTNSISASEVKVIMSEMTFESNRLSIAKYAYAFCYDPENYFLVNDGFEFRTSISELNEYIGA